MYPFTGYWIECINEVDTRDIDESETERHFAGEVAFRYDTSTAAQNKFIRDIVEGLGTVKKYYVLQTEAELPFKPGDSVKLYDGNVYGVDQVTEYIADRYKRLVGMNPALRDRYKTRLLVVK